MDKIDDETGGTNRPMRLTRLIACALCALGLAIQPLAAQDVITPAAKPGDRDASAPASALPDDPAPLGATAPLGAPAPLGNLLGGNAVPGSSTPVVPYAPAITPDTGMPGPSNQSPVYLVARLSDDGPSLTEGVRWRVYASTPNEQGKLELVATAQGGDADFRLAPGDYFVHTAYGYAGRTSRIAVRNGLTSQTVMLNAGGIKLDAQFSGQQPIQTGRVVFDIYERDFDSRGERKLVVGNVKPGAIVRLNADTYHVVSRYGAVNATVRADIRVEPGKLTEATVYHNAARMTLKLVNQSGGEAIANTKWSVLTPGGDVVVEGTGAFPAFILAAGEYQVIARNEDKLYSRQFEVNTASHGEVEVLTGSLLKQ